MIILCEQRGYEVAPIVNNKHDKSLSRHYFYKSKKYDARQFPHTVDYMYILRRKSLYNLQDENETTSGNVEKMEKKMERLLKRNVNRRRMQSVNGQKEYEQKHKFLNEIKEKFSDFELLMKENIQLTKDEINQSYGVKGCYEYYIPYVRWHELCND